MLVHLASFLAGFTIISAVILVFAYWFFLPDLKKNTSSKLACACLLFSLAALQWCHYLALVEEFNALDSIYYLVLLLSVPSFFYYFSRFVLFPESVLRLRHGIYFLPVAGIAVLPWAQIPLFAFIVGSGYTFWFARLVLVLRHQHQRFHLERFFFVLFAVFAAIALLLGLFIPTIDPVIFYATYGSSIGIAMLLVVTAMIIFPEMLSDIQQVAELAYAKSRLGGVDTELKQQQLEQLLNTEEIYQDESLSLAMVADRVEMTPHQLSELINTHYGFSFSRLVRGCRIKQAQRLLETEPQTSVLAISMMTGFKSQSNFYAAFKEVTGESPGHYRKRALKVS